MSDSIQTVLERRRARTCSRVELDAACRQLRMEWRPQLRRLLRRPSPEEVEDLLQGALLELVLDGGERPRALAPVGASSPTAWRRTVLSNWVVDVLRARRRRLHAVQAMAAGLSPRAEKARWKSAKAQRAFGSLRTSPEVSPGSSLSVHMALTTLDHRRRLAALLPDLPVRRRVLLLLAMGSDPIDHAEELAGCLSEPTSRVAARMRTAVETPHDGSHDYLSAAMVRVVYPEPKPLAAAREAARKVLEGAVVALRKEAGEAGPRRAA